jgi:hypothetical protein
MKLRRGARARRRLRKRQQEHDEIIKDRHDKGKGYRKPGSLNHKKG